MNALPQTPELTALVVDDEPQIRRLLTVTLEANGYRVVAVENGREAVIMAAQYRPDIVILDLGLPDLDGQVVLKRLREWSSTPVIILTVKDDPSEKIAALDEGADDFVTKPFHAGELLARMRAALRHSDAHEEPAVFKSGDLVVDLACRQVMRGRKEVKLTSTEYSLLRFLIRHAGKVLTHRQILQEVLGQDTTTALITFASIWRTCVKSWRPIPRNPSCFLPSLGWDIDSYPNRRVGRLDFVPHLILHFVLAAAPRLSAGPSARLRKLRHRKLHPPVKPSTDSERPGAIRFTALFCFNSTYIRSPHIVAHFIRPAHVSPD